MTDGWVEYVPETVRTPELVAAECVALMAEHAAIKPRGFNTIRERAIPHERIDHLLDELRDLADLASL